MSPDEFRIRTLPQGGLPPNGRQHAQVSGALPFAGSGVDKEEGPAMKLGILVNTDRHLDHLLGIIRAAVSKNHEVMVFAMDDGIHLFGDPSFSDLAGAGNVSMSICRH
ncbi:MAG: hypothetical protein V3S33_05180, partial [Gammaproteobacteria bacterium]